MSAELDFGAWLQRRRRGLGFTQAELGQRIGYSGETIRKVEAGALRPSRPMVERLADSLDIPAAERRAFLRFALDDFTDDFGVGTVVASIPLSAGARPNLPSLPTPPTRLVGRDADATAVHQILSRPEVRYVTLTGPGGVGKTRLALEVARRAAPDFPNGVLFVDLAPVTEPDLVASTLTRALGLKDRPGATPTDNLKAFLARQRLLLVLDNYEQIVASAPWLADILGVAPTVKALVTSRVPLRLRGEREFSVPPLTLPDRAVWRAASSDPQALAQSPAVQLFLDRMQDIQPDFTLTVDNTLAIAEICARLDGLPLALELAAARSKVLAPADLARRLDRRLALLTTGPSDLPTRQQTLRATIDWSYGLLTRAEQALFARLGVLVGGFTLESAHAVGHDGDPVDDVLAGLHSLADKSLVRPVTPLQTSGAATGERRFTMLETVREYALEKLAARGESHALRQRHADFFLRVAEQAEAPLMGAAQALWLDRLNQEWENLRAAWGWFMEHERVEAALRLASALRRFWEVQADPSEGRLWLREGLARGQGVEPAVRAKALHTLANLLSNAGDHRGAIVLGEQAWRLRRELGDDQGTARTLNNLAIALWYQGEYRRAQILYEESLTIKRRLNDRLGIAYSLNNLGLLALDLDEYERAWALLSEGLNLRRELGDRLGAAISLMNQGIVAQQQGDLAQAVSRYETSLVDLISLDDRPSIARAQNNLALAVAQQGDFKRAHDLLDASQAWRREVGNARELALGLLNVAQVALYEGDLSQARLAAEDGLTLARQEGHRLHMARALNLVGRVALKERRFDGLFPVFEEAVGLAELVGNRREVLRADLGLGWLAYDHTDLEHAQRHFSSCLGLAHAMGAHLSVAESLEALGAVYLARYQPTRGALLLGHATVLRERRGAPVPPCDKPDLDASLATLRHQLSAAELADAWAAGAARPIHDIVAQETGR